MDKSVGGLLEKIANFISSNTWSKGLLTKKVDHSSWIPTCLGTPRRILKRRSNFCLSCLTLLPIFFDLKICQSVRYYAEKDWKVHFAKQKTKKKYKTADPR